MPSNPQKENGYTPIANEIMEALMRINLSPAETRVLWYLFRKTYGWGKKSDTISLSQFAKATGLKRQNAQRALKALASKSMIIVIRGDDRKPLTYRFQKDYSRWSLSSIPMTGRKTVIRGDDKTVISSEAHKRKERKKITGNKQKRARSPKQTNSEIRIFIDWWCEEYRKLKGIPYHVTGSKEAPLIQKLLKTYPRDQLTTMASAFLRSDDPFIHRVGFGIGIFVSQINKFAQQTISQKPLETIPTDEALRRMADGTL